jgi:hypothetical protein
MIIPYQIWYKRKIRNNSKWDHCSDCTAEPVKKEISIHPSLGRIECIPYLGEVNDLWQPINAVGDLYLPGERLCGKSDCINLDHIRQPEPKTVDPVELILALSEIRQAHRKLAK